MRTNYKNFTNEKNEVNNEMLRDILKKLNINDFEFLQTLPFNYTEGVPENQRKKMIGNGWTISVISHIFSHLPKNVI